MAHYNIVLQKKFINTGLHIWQCRKQFSQIPRKRCWYQCKISNF